MSLRHIDDQIHLERWGGELGDLCKAAGIPYPERDLPLYERHPNAADAFAALVRGAWPEITAEVTALHPLSERVA